MCVISNSTAAQEEEEGERREFKLFTHINKHRVLEARAMKI